MANRKLEQGSVGRLHEAVILVAVLAFAVTIRRLTLREIEIGGDAIQKWFFVRQWFWANDFSHAQWNHHMARFGVNLWAFVSQWLFGNAPPVYYVAPIFAASIQAVLSYAVARRIAGVIAGLVAVVLLVTFAPMSRAGSQLLPGIFSGTYVMAGCWCFLQSIDTEERQSHWVVLAAVALFFAYLAKLPNLFFVPGFAFALWFAHRKLRLVALFLGVLALLFVCESLYYLSFTDYWNRLDVIFSSHLSGKGPTRKGIQVLFQRYTSLPHGWRLVFFSFPAAWLSCAAFARDRRVKGLCIIAGIFFLIKTFAIRGVSPIRLLELNHPRYLIVSVPLVCVIIALFLRMTMCRLLKGTVESNRPLQRLSAQLSRPVYASLGSVLLLSAIVFLKYGHRFEPVLENNMPLNKLEERRQILTRTYRAGLPMVASKNERRRSLRAAWRFFLPDELLVKSGVLPTERDNIQRLGKLDWLSSDPENSREVTKLRLKRKKCYLRLKKHHKLLRYRPRKGLSEACFKGKSP